MTRVGTGIGVGIRIGSEGSQLARWQAHHVADLLRGQGHVVEIEVIKTTGDRLQEVTFAQVGTKGMFTLEIEEALAAGRIDLAVHSLKDLPTELPAGFTRWRLLRRGRMRGMFLFRGSMRVWVRCRQGRGLGRVVCGGGRLLRYRRPDLECVEFRGNVDTRLRKLDEGWRKGFCLAGAGLDRLDKTEWVRERMAVEEMCPAPGRGALGIESRAGDERILEAVAFLDDPTTRFCVTAERAALAALGGGYRCRLGCIAIRLGMDGDYEILAGGGRSGW